MGENPLPLPSGDSTYPADLSIHSLLLPLKPIATSSHLIGHLTASSRAHCSPPLTVLISCAHCLCPLPYIHLLPPLPHTLLLGRTNSSATPHAHLDHAMFALRCAQYLPIVLRAKENRVSEENEFKLTFTASRHSPPPRRRLQLPPTPPQDTPLLSTLAFPAEASEH